MKPNSKKEQAGYSPYRVENKFSKVLDLELKRNPPKPSAPKLEKGLSKGDRKKGFSTYLQMGRATI